MEQKATSSPSGSENTSVSAKIRQVLPKPVSSCCVTERNVIQAYLKNAASGGGSAPPDGKNGDGEA